MKTTRLTLAVFLALRMAEMAYAVSCTVTFNKMSGTGGTDSVTATLGSPMPAITLPTRTGYTFGGYFTTKNDSGNQYYTSSGESARIWDINTPQFTLYAKWTANTYAVTLDRQGGTGGTDSVTATYGSQPPKITPPTRNGYTFHGYCSLPDGEGTLYYSEAGFPILAWDLTSSTTLYAKWSANNYWIEFDRQDGSGGTLKQVATFGNAMPDITLPTKTGCTFGGYFTLPGGVGTQYYTASGTSARDWDIAAETTLYAKWETTLSVALDNESLVFSTGGDLPWFGQTVWKRDGQDAAQSGAIANDQNSWLDTSVRGPGTIAFSWNVSCESNDDVTWDYLEFLVDGKQVKKIGGTDLAWRRESITISGAGTHSIRWNYHKDGVYSKGYDCGWVDIVTWTPKVMTVTLDQQGGSDGTESVTVKYEDTMPAITPPTRAFYRFGGYFMAPEGVGTQFYTAGGASSHAWTRAEDTTLYAKWLENHEPVFGSVWPTVDSFAMESDTMVTFSASGSDPDGDAVSIAWHWCDQTSYAWHDGPLQSYFEFTPDKAGTYVVMAVLLDADWRVPHTWEVRVMPPTVTSFGEIPGSALAWFVVGPKLTICGHDHMPEWDLDDPAACPYSAYANVIADAMIEEGVMSVGACAFSQLPNLITAALPDTAETIGGGAFANCGSLRAVYIPSEFIGQEDALGIRSGCEVISTDIYKFVRRLYQVCLGREPDREGCIAWTTRLKYGERDGAMAAYGFLMSKEMKNRDLSDADFIEILYNAMLGRTSDSGGKDTWCKRLDSGVSRTGVINGFAKSAEFAALCDFYGIVKGSVTPTLLEERDKNFNVTMFVARLYKKALDRKYDINGLNNWCQKINSSSTKKATAIQVSKSFLNSAEFQKRNLSNSDFVDVLYWTYLDRAPDAGGKQYWVNKLNSGASRASVMAGFYNSAEFNALMASYGLH